MKSILNTAGGTGIDAEIEKQLWPPLGGPLTRLVDGMLHAWITSHDLSLFDWNRHRFLIEVEPGVQLIGYQDTPIVCVNHGRVYVWD